MSHFKIDPVSEESECPPKMYDRYLFIHKTFIVVNVSSYISERRWAFIGKTAGARDRDEEHVVVEL